MFKLDITEWDYVCVGYTFPDSVVVELYIIIYNWSYLL